MAQKWEYVGNCSTPTTVADAIKDEWETTLSGETARIYSALTTKIATEQNFKDKIATPSSNAFDAFLQSVGGKWSLVDIKLKQKVKLTRAYTKWDARIDEVFGGGTPTFPDTVTATKSRLDELGRVLGGVGHRSLDSWGAITMAVLLARGDTRCSTYFDANDDWTGTLEAVFDPVKGALLSPSLIAEMVRCMVMAKYADEAGLTSDRDTMITTCNTRLDELIQVALSDTYKGTGYDFTIVLSWNGTNEAVDITATATTP